jgi:hypothetical protein
VRVQILALPYDSATYAVRLGAGPLHLMGRALTTSMPLPLTLRGSPPAVPASARLPAKPQRLGHLYFVWVVTASDTAGRIAAIYVGDLLPRVQTPREPAKQLLVVARAPALQASPRSALSRHFPVVSRRFTDQRRKPIHGFRRFSVPQQPQQQPQPDRVFLRS